MFYGSEHSKLRPTNAEYVFVESLGNLYQLMLGCWRRETCAPRMQGKWSEANPTCGHCFNVVGDAVFDLTSEQFDHPLAYTMDFPQSRETHFAKAEKKARYETLKDALKRKAKS